MRKKHDPNKHLRYPRGAIVNGVNVGGKFMPKQGRFVVLVGQNKPVRAIAAKLAQKTGIKATTVNRKLMSAVKRALSAHRASGGDDDQKTLRRVAMKAVADEVRTLIGSRKGTALKEGKSPSLRDRIEEIEKKHERRIALLKDQLRKARKERNEVRSGGSNADTEQLTTKINALRKRIETAEKKYSNEREKLIHSLLEPTVSRSILQRQHGMSEPEYMWACEFEGIKFHGTAMFSPSHKALKVIDELLKRPKLPDSFTRHTSDIYFTDQKNKDDAYWQEVYKIKGFTSAATGGDGKVVFYSSSSPSLDVLVHEMGHNFAKGRYGQTRPPQESQYAKVIKSKEPPATWYGTTDPGEDFAETAELYFSYPRFLKKEAPRRFKIFDQMVKDEDFNG